MSTIRPSLKRSSGRAFAVPTALVRSLVVVQLCALGALCGTVAAMPEDPPDAYEIAARAAVPILPDPLRSFFEQHHSDLIRVSLSYRMKSASSTKRSGNAEPHFVMLDAAATGSDPVARAEAVRGFPRDRAKANELAREMGVKHVGELPWVIFDHYGALVEAFRVEDQDQILAEAGAILHFATDAALPYQLTVWKAGTEIKKASDVEGNSIETTLRRRDLLEETAEFSDRLLYEVRVSPARYHRWVRPLDAIFETLIDARLRLSNVSAADLKTHDEVALLETRLESAALLGADLIGTAWVQAGRPKSEGWMASSKKSRNATLDDSSPSGVKSNEATADAAPKVAFVGSRSSTIFHVAGCMHAKRIKPENIVSFDTDKAAKRAGRKPCKSCKPGG